MAFTIASKQFSLPQFHRPDAASLSQAFLNILYYQVRCVDDDLTAANSLGRAPMRRSGRSWLLHATGRPLNWGKSYPRLKTLAPHPEMPNEKKGNGLSWPVCEAPRTDGPVADGGTAIGNAMRCLVGTRRRYPLLSTSTSHCFAASLIVAHCLRIPHFVALTIRLGLQS